MKKAVSVLVTFVILVLGYANVMAASDNTTSFKMTFKWYKDKATTSITKISGLNGCERDRYVEARLVNWNSYSGGIIRTYQSSSASDSTSGSTTISTTTSEDDDSGINYSYHYAYVDDGYKTAAAKYVVNTQQNFTHKHTIYF